MLNAGPRSSANYTITADTADAGGLRTTSASYTNHGSAGAVTGISNSSSQAFAAKAGYIGQLYDVTGFVVNAPAPNLNENTQLQLTGAQLLDDGSRLSVNGSAVSWSVVSGPVSSIGASGIATATTVYQTTSATVQGVYLGITGTLNLSIVNVNNDDYGGYANDGLPDDWQVRYFGLNNPNAAPSVDADGTGQTNLFKYAAGLNPIDPTSVFTLSILPVPNQPAQTNLAFSPIVAGRSYTVEFSTDLTSWNTLTGAAQSDNTTLRTVTDLDSSGERKFYRVLISIP